MIKIFVNLITTFRFLFSLTIPSMQNNVSDFIIISVIIFLYLTDFIDGFLARKYKVQTFYGSMLDTVADKTLSIILILLIIGKNRLLIFVLILEILIALINIYGTITGKKISSSIIGKIKTWCIAITIIFSYMNRYVNINYIIIKISACITIFMQIFTFLGYLKNIISQRKSKKMVHKIYNFNDLKYILFNTEYYNKMMQKNIDEKV